MIMEDGQTNDEFSYCEKRLCILLFLSALPNSFATLQSLVTQYTPQHHCALTDVFDEFKPKVLYTNLRCAAVKLLRLQLKFVYSYQRNWGLLNIWFELPYRSDSNSVKCEFRFARYDNTFTNHFVSRWRFFVCFALCIVLQSSNNRKQSTAMSWGCWCLRKQVVHICASWVLRYAGWTHLFTSCYNSFQCSLSLSGAL